MRDSIWGKKVKITNGKYSGKEGKVVGRAGRESWLVRISGLGGAILKEDELEEIYKNEKEE